MGKTLDVYCHLISPLWTLSESEYLLGTDAKRKTSRYVKIKKLNEQLIGENSWEYPAVRLDHNAEFFEKGFLSFLYFDKYLKSFLITYSVNI